MENGERPSMSQRNAENVARFKGLPAAGSPAYWAELENAAKETRLALEILVMCARERLAAGRLQDAERVYTLLLNKTQGTVRNWVSRLTPSKAHDREGVIEEIMQECAMNLWLELSGDGPTFLTEGFWHKLTWMTKNVVKQVLIARGIKARTNSTNSTRIQEDLIESIDKPVGVDDNRTLGESIIDPQAGDAFSLMELVNDIRALLVGLTSEERLLLQNEITGELTQREMGERLGITDRAVRMRLKALYDKLRARYNPYGDSGGGAAGGEEGRA